MKVLVPMDGSDPSRAALEHALTTFPEAEVVVLHVIDIGSSYAYGGEMAYYIDTIREIGEEQAEEIFEEAQTIAETYDREISTKCVEGSASRSIVRVAEDIGIDHIVIGSHGRTGVTRILLGSVAERVTRRAPVTVTVVREWSSMHRT